MKKFMAFCAMVAFVLFVAACGGQDRKTEEMDALEKIEGVWQGAIQLPGQELGIQLDFTEAGGTLSIPAQGVSEIAFSRLEFIDPDILVELDLQGQKLVFDGRLEEGVILGTFKQGAQEFPFELTKGSKKDASVEENLIEMQTAAGKMKAKLELPKGEGLFPVVVIIAGSGPTDADGNSAIGGSNNSLKMLAEGLAAEGIASIRYDKRGVGVNAGLAGKEEELRFNDFISDAASWTEFGKNDDRFTDVGIIGHSEGSLIGMVAARQAGADSFISIAGPARPIGELLLEQLRPQLPESLMKEAEEIIEELEQGTAVDEVDPALYSLFRPSVQPYMISWMQYDPRTELEKLEVPVLIAAGSRDLQVPLSDAEALQAAKAGSELLAVEEMNHVLKIVPDGRQENLAAYSDPDLPLADELLEGIVEFINRNN